MHLFSFSHYAYTLTAQANKYNLLIQLNVIDCDWSEEDVDEKTQHSSDELIVVVVFVLVVKHTRHSMIEFQN